MENMKKYESTIMNWLKAENQMMCIVEAYSSRHAFIKIPLTEGYDILYVCKRLQGERLSLHEELEYQGFYEKSTGLLYNVQYEMRNYIGEELYEQRSSSNLKIDFECEVRELVEKKVSEFEDTIKLDRTTKDIQKEYNYAAQNQARNMYLHRDGTDLIYQCPYEADRFDYTMLEYVKDKKEFVKETAERYCTEARERIVKDIVLNLMTRELLKKMENGNDKHLSAMRDIINSIPDSCKMVHVTTVIDEKEFTFKYEASSLRSDCGSHYYTWSIPARDRAEFENIYGRNARFKPEDITKIVYGKNVLYKKE